MTHDELVGKVVRAMCEAVGAESLDEVDLRAYRGQAIDAIAIVLEEAAKVAERAGRYPVGAGDGNTYVIGSASDAAAAIRKLKGDA
jgi:hypothetical protein